MVGQLHSLSAEVMIDVGVFVAASNVSIFRAIISRKKTDLNQHSLH